MRHSFQTEQWLPYPRERLFAFFANPANLPPLMPRWQRARVEKADYVSPPAPPSPSASHAVVPMPGALGVAAGAGSLITISFRPIPLLPLRLKWEAYIAEFRWNDFFCDEQRRGPFRYFHHCHRVRDEIREGAAGAVVSDVLEYELPMGPLDDLLNRLAMKRQIRALFAYRQRMLAVLRARSQQHCQGRKRERVPLAGDELPAGLVLQIRRELFQRRFDTDAVLGAQGFHLAVLDKAVWPSDAHDRHLDLHFA
jgi:ligand-binding SRPBCC domain-containing protein